MKILVQMLLLSFLLLECQQPMVRGVHTPKQDSEDPAYPGIRQRWPTVVALSRRVARVYSVPILNSIATCDVARGIGLFEFNKHNVKYKVVMSHAIEEPYGGDVSFCPVLPDSTVFYCQSRRINRIDIAQGHAEQFLPQMDGPFIERFEVLDPISETLAIEYNVHTQSYGPTCYRDVIKIIDFGQWSYDVVCEIDVGKTPIVHWAPWTAHDGKLLAWDDSSRTMRVWNQDGEEATHAFAEVLNRHASKFQCIRKLIIHDRLNIAFVMASPTPEAPKDDYSTETDSERLSLWCITRNRDSSSAAIIFERAIDLPGLPSNCTVCEILDIQFSPDGNWLLIVAEVFTQALTDVKYFFASPISPSLSDFIGAPVKLARPDRHPYWALGNAWISDPLSFVVAGGDRLYKWELEGLHEKLVEEYRAGH